MVEPIRELLDAGIQSDRSEVDERWILALREEVKSAEVEISSVLAEATLSVGELVNLRPGDVIPIEMPKFVTAFAEDVPVFRAKLGESRGNLAVKLVQHVERPQQG